MITHAYGGDFNVMPAGKPVTWPSPTPKPSQLTPDEAAIQELLAHSQKIQNAVQDIQSKQESILPIGKIVSIAQNPKTFMLMKSLVDITQSPQATVFYGVEAVWFIAIILLRTWKIRQARSGFQGLWIQLYMTVIYFIGAGAAIPFFFMSSEARKLILSFF